MDGGRDLSALLRPGRVAVVGASDRPGSAGQVIWANLEQFTGERIPVSRSAATVSGVPAYPSLADIPGGADLAVAVVPAAACVEVVRDAGAAGVGALIIVGGGFAEAGVDGAQLQRQLVAAAAEQGVRLLGPNCLGVQVPALGLSASLAASAATAGSIGLITQSGAYAMSAAMLGADEGDGFTAVVSTGNGADISEHELVTALADDPATRVIALFVETIRHGRQLTAAIRAASLRVPVIVTIVGRTDAGARAATSHTAALAAPRRVWADLLRDAGAIVTDSGQQMLDTARVLAGQGVPAGRRAAIITNSGGTGTELADLLTGAGLVVPELSGPLQQQIRALLPDLGSARNPVDITTVWSRFGELYPALTDLLARSGEIDIVVPVLLHRAAVDPQVAAGLIDVVARLREDKIPAVVHGCWVAPAQARSAAAPLQAAGIACLDWPGRTAVALGAAAQAPRTPQPHQVTDVGPEASADSTARQDGAQDAALPLRPRGSRQLPDGAEHDPAATAALLDEYGIALISTLTGGSIDEAVAAAEQLGYPVMVKVEHHSIVHKSDVGGVRGPLTDAAAVGSAAADLLALADGARVSVQQVARGVEVLVGAVDDPTFGPVIGVGVGGILVELFDDVTFLPAPVDRAAVDRLLQAGRLGQLLHGLRGSAAADRESLATLIVAAGELIVDHPQLAELDLNPVLAGPGGAACVDVRLIRHNPAPSTP